MTCCSLALLCLAPAGCTSPAQSSAATAQQFPTTAPAASAAPDPPAPDQPSTVTVAVAPSPAGKSSAKAPTDRAANKGRPFQLRSPAPAPDPSVGIVQAVPAPAPAAPAAQPLPARTAEEEQPAQPLIELPLQSADTAAGRDANIRLLMVLVRQNTIDMGNRVLAVRNLLECGWPEAMDALVGDLVAGADASTSAVIARALSELPADPPAHFEPVLIDLLGRADAALLPDVAAALGRYHDPALLAHLVTVALSPRSQPNHRLGAVASLGYQRTQGAAGALLQLIDARQPAAIRDAAFSGLIQLTGIANLGTDVQGWQAWWETCRDLPKERWLALLTDNFARRAVNLASQSRQMQDRLIQAQRQLYRQAGEEARPALLIAMLNDPLEASRIEAMNLAFQSHYDGKPLGPELRQALLQKLDDPSPVLRERAARLLYDEKDQSAAQLIARQLLIGSEHHPEVLRVYLLMMARVPQPAAVKPALDLLTDPRLRSEAAAALAAAAQQQLLGEPQILQAGARARQALAAMTEPDPQMISLLGLVGNSQDWQQIALWLDSPHEPAKAAAANAWARSRRSLLPLAGRLTDPVIETVALVAAKDRGDEPLVLLALLQNAPEKAESLALWRRALVAMSARVGPAAVLAADQTMDRLNRPAELRLQMLTAAIDALNSAVPGTAPALSTTIPEPPQPADPNALAQEPPPAPTPLSSAGTQSLLIDLLLARADTRLKAGDPQTAVTDYQRIDSLQADLSPSQRQQREQGGLRASLLAGELDEAFAQARDLLDPQRGEQPELRAKIIDWFLNTAERDLTNGVPGPARRILANLPRLLGAQASSERIDKLRRALGQPAALAPGLAPTTQPLDTAPTTQPAAVIPAAPTPPTAVDAPAAPVAP